MLLAGINACQAQICLAVPRLTIMRGTQFIPAEMQEPLPRRIPLGCITKQNVLEISLKSTKRNCAAPPQHRICCRAMRRGAFA